MAKFAPQDSSWRQRVCSARRVTLVLMGLLAVVTLSITVFGFMGRKYSTTLWKMQEDLKVINRTIATELAALQQNGTDRGCCPWDWHLFQQSCYWLSSAQKNWTEAKQDCEDKQAHLVVITSHLEKQFVYQLTKKHSVWIGLKYEDQTWRWVDGTLYTMNRTDWWSYVMHYDNYCTKTYRDGLWTHAFCHCNLLWMCEMQVLQ